MSNPAAYQQNNSTGYDNSTTNKISNTKLKPSQRLDWTFSYISIKVEFLSMRKKFEMSCTMLAHRLSTSKNSYWYSHYNAILHLSLVGRSIRASRVPSEGLRPRLLIGCFVLTTRFRKCSHCAKSRTCPSEWTHAASKVLCSDGGAGLEGNFHQLDDQQLQ